MAQVIEVRFLNPATGENLCDEFTKADSHEEAIKLAYHEFSVGRDSSLKEVYKDPDYETVQGQLKGTGSSFAWKYIYRCVIEDPEGGSDLSMLAVLFTTHKERGTNALPS